MAITLSLVRYVLSIVWYGVRVLAPLWQCVCAWTYIHVLFIQPLEPKSLFKLNFHKNADGELVSLPVYTWVYRFAVDGVVLKGSVPDSFCPTLTGMYHCPVTYKVFNENTHIVVVKTTGNVYCMEVSLLMVQ